MMPYTWQEETTGQLKRAILRFQNSRSHLTVVDIKVLKVYFSIWVRTSMLPRKEKKTMFDDLTSIQDKDGLKDFHSRLKGYGMHPLAQPNVKREN